MTVVDYILPENENYYNYHTDTGSSVVIVDELFINIDIFSLKMKITTIITQIVV